MGPIMICEKGSLQKKGYSCFNPPLPCPIPSWSCTQKEISTFFNPSLRFFSSIECLSIVISKRNSLTNFLKALLSSGTTSNVIIQLIFGRTRHLFGRNKEKIKEIIKDLLDMKDNLMTNKIMELRVEQLPYLWSLRPSSLPLLSTSCGDNSGF